MKKRVTYRPSKAQGAFGMIWGGVFVLIGLFVVVPTFGAFGLLWTIAAIAMTAYQGYLAFGKNYAGPEIQIEEDENFQRETGSSPTSADHNHVSSTALTPQKRLEQLNTLKDAGLLTDQEYKQKRQEILRDL